MTMKSLSAIFIHFLFLQGVRSVFIVYDGYANMMTYNDTGDFVTKRGTEECLAFADVVCPAEDLCYAVSKKRPAASPTGFMSEKCVNASVYVSNDNFETADMLPTVSSLFKDNFQDRRIDCEGKDVCALIGEADILLTTSDGWKTVQAVGPPSLNPSSNLVDVAVTCGGKVVVIGRDGYVALISNLRGPAPKVTPLQESLKGTGKSAGIRLKEITCAGCLCVIIGENELFFSNDGGTTWRNNSTFSSARDSDVAPCVIETELMCWFKNPFWSSVSCMNETFCVVVASRPASLGPERGDSVMHMPHVPGGVCWSTDAAETWSCGNYIFNPRDADPVYLDSVHCDSNSGNCLSYALFPQRRRRQGLLHFSWPSPSTLKVRVLDNEFNGDGRTLYKVAGLSVKPAEYRFPEETALSKNVNGVGNTNTASSIYGYFQICLFLAFCAMKMRACGF